MLGYYVLVRLLGRQRTRVSRVGRWPLAPVSALHNRVVAFVGSVAAVAHTVADAARVQPLACAAVKR